MLDTGEMSPLRTSGLTWTDGSGQAYDQEAFRYFLALERSRSARSNRPFLLLLVGIRRRTDRSIRRRRIDPALAGRLFSALWLCIRETDFIGWYREERLAGAVLTQRADGSEAGKPRQARERVIRAMAERLPKDVVDRLHVRVCRVSSYMKARS